MYAGSYFLSAPAADVWLDLEPPYDLVQLPLPSLDPGCIVAPRFVGRHNLWPKDALLEQIARFVVLGSDLDDLRSRRVLASEFIAMRLSRVQQGRVAPLQAWRLKNVQTYIETKIQTRIQLKDLAKEARLSPMHFAAQFRATTGLKPRDYVLARRIERAKEMIASSNGSLAQIALESGFQGQSHFTATFKRFVGETPGSWRRNTMT